MDNSTIISILGTIIPLSIPIIGLFVLLGKKGEQIENLRIGQQELKLDFKSKKNEQDILNKNYSENILKHEMTVKSNEERISSAAIDIKNLGEATLHVSNSVVNAAKDIEHGMKTLKKDFYYLDKEVKTSISGIMENVNKLNESHKNKVYGESK